MAAPTPRAPLISVVIPVHNAAPYLRQCLDSVLGQTWSDIEVICVDDASTDASPSILAQYAARDPRVKILGAGGRGVSAARNAGIDASRGEWLNFIDADDAMPPTALALLLETAQKTHATAAVAPYRRVRQMPGPPPPARIKTEMMEGQEAMARCLYQRGMDGGVCGKLWAASLFGSDMRFRPGRFEDLDLIYRLYSRCRRVALLHAPLYWYRTHEGQFISSMKSEGRFDSLAVCERALEYTASFPAPVRRAAKCRLLAASMNAIGLVEAYGLEGKEELEKRCFKHLGDLRLSVLTCRRARLRDRLGALAAWLPRPALRALLRRAYRPFS